MFLYVRYSIRLNVAAQRMGNEANAGNLISKIVVLMFFVFDDAAMPVCRLVIFARDLRCEAARK